MIPPTSIDGTDITGATIDGTDVQEITVDGQTVFTAGAQINNFPVAYSNLIAWYPFDSATYGGSNADDVTALFNPGQSGDSTAYDGTVNGATYQSSGGVTDINAGANSGAFEFFGGSDEVRIGPNLTLGGRSEFSIMFWAFPESRNFNRLAAETSGGLSNSQSSFVFVVSSTNTTFNVYDGPRTVTDFSDSTQNAWIHYAVTYDNGTLTMYSNGNSQVTNSVGNVGTGSDEFVIGNDDQSGSNGMDGYIDDFRVYNSALSSPQISQIVSNTPHP